MPVLKTLSPVASPFIQGEIQGLYHGLQSVMICL